MNRRLFNASFKLGEQRVTHVKEVAFSLRPSHKLH